jgi:hypothetical protein
MLPFAVNTGIKPKDQLRFVFIVPRPKNPGQYHATIGCKELSTNAEFGISGEVFIGEGPDGCSPDSVDEKEIIRLDLLGELGSVDFEIE